MSDEIRPPWWRVALGVFGGASAGGTLFVWIANGLLYLAEPFADFDLQQSFEGLDAIAIVLGYIYWGLALAVIQLFSVALGAWSKVLWLSAALSTFWLAALYSGPEYIPLWLLPWIIAFAFSRMHWPKIVAARAQATRTAQKSA